MVYRRRVRTGGWIGGDDCFRCCIGNRVVVCEETRTGGAGLMAIEKVAVVGGGTMGNGIAHVFAQHNYDVVLIDVDEQRLQAALKTIRGNFDRQVKKAALSESDAATAVARIRTTTKRGDAAGAELIVEAVPERLDLRSEEH